MAWTTPRTWTTTELVTAAMMNSHVRDNLVYLAGWGSAVQEQTVTGFTNTAFADLDALTTSPFSSPVIVSVSTGTSALVIVSAVIMLQNSAGTGIMSYRVSGATTVASSDTRGVRLAFGIQVSQTYASVLTGLTAGTNTFELQARVTSNNANLTNPTLTVIPKP